MVDPRALSHAELLALLTEERWFASKDRVPDRAEVVDLPVDEPGLALAIVEVGFRSGGHEHYTLALATDGEHPQDALARPELVARLAALCGIDTPGATVRPMGVEQSNSSIVIDERHVLKLYRRLQPGPNPEVELLRALAEQGFLAVPRLEGAFETEGPPLEASLVSVTALVPAAGDGWTLALDSFVADSEWLPKRAGRLGEVTAQLHAALAANEDDPHLAPAEPGAEALQLVVAALDEEIRSTFAALPDGSAASAIAHRVADVRDLAHELGSVGPEGLLIRTHGDYHLGQVLWAEASAWVVLDFEGEPARSLIERRRRRSALRDVAGMVRSFAYAEDASLLVRGVMPPDGWGDSCREAFLEGYRAAADPRLLPSSRVGFDRLLALFELEKLVYEVGYETRNRPDWAAIPVAGILRALERAAVA